MTSKPRLLWTLALAVGLMTAGSAQQPTPSAPPGQQPAPSAPPAQEPAPTDAPQPQARFRADINFVRVDVIVTDDGKPVLDLTQGDFEVLEDGKPQNVEQFRLVRVDGTPRTDDRPPRPIRSRDDEETEAARDDTRVIAIFLDDYHTRLGNAISVRRPLIEFIQTQLRPTDMVAIMYPLMPVTELRFTRDHDSLISAINIFEGRKYRYESRNAFEAQYERQPTEVVEQVRNQVTMSALQGLATRLGSIREGRKAVVFVSEGFTILLPPQMRSADASMPCLSAQQQGCGAVGQPMVGENNPNEDRARFMTQADVYSRMREVYAEFNRNNTSIYSMDPRGLATGEFSIDENVGPSQDRVSLQMTQDTLRTLAEETDGAAIVGRNDLARGLQQLVRDSSYYYLMGYTSSAPTDGKFHEIKINVRRRGVEVRGRRGFWAATAADVTRVTTPAPTVSAAVTSALAAISAPVQSTQAVRTWIGTERGDNGRTKVTLVWEPIAGAPGTRREMAGRVSVIAATAAGDLVYRGRSDSPANSSAPASNGGSASGGASPASTASPLQRIAFDAPPGPIELRLSVEAVGGGVIDNDVRKLTVPDLTAPQVAVSTPRVFRARTARDLQTVMANGAAIPSPIREFSRSERLLIRFDTYAAGGEMPKVTAALLNRGGQKMADVPVMPAAVAGTHQVDLGLASVAPGEYLVEITAKGTGGEVKELLAFRVIS